MKKRRPVLSVFLSIALVVGLCPGLAFAIPQNDADTPLEAQAGNIAEGTWGTCPWEITADDVLIVHPGEGEDKYYADCIPWEKYETLVKRIVFLEENGKKVVAPADCRSLFSASNSYSSRLHDIDFSGFDTSRVTDMSYMFGGCSSLTSLDLSSFDTSRVTDMSYMFEDCSSFASLDLSSFDTSQVTDMSGMFGTSYGSSTWNRSSLTSLDLTSFDTSQVTDMSGMFRNCRSLVSLDLSSFDTSNVTNVNEMFSGCSSLISLDLSSFNTSKATNMGQMFGGCSSLVNLDLSSFDTSKNELNYFGIFVDFHATGNDPTGCTSLRSVKVGPNFVFYDSTAAFGSAWLPGEWRSQANGKAYTLESISECNNVADTYVKVSSAPVVDEGAQGSWSRGSDEGLAFRSAAPLRDFQEVRIDGAFVSGDHYVLREGSTIVEFVPRYLETISSGNHSIDIVSTTGTATSHLSISDVATQVMYRLYNPNSGEHFYTASTIERDNVIAAGWNDEGIGWTAPTEGIKVYRLYNRFAGEHHYTTSEAERDMLVGVGWIWEEGGWFSSPNEAVPLYRAYNPNAYANNHHYTTDWGEFQTLLGFGWRDEGVGWYGVR